MPEEWHRPLATKIKTMGSSITASNLIVTVSESITLNSQPINSENQLVIANINEVDKRIMSVPISSEVTIAAFSTSVAAGQYIGSDVKYIRVANKDLVNYARIRVKKNGGATFDTRLDAGKFFIMGNTKESVSETAAVFSNFADMDSINAQADTAAVDLEIFVASI